MRCPPPIIGLSNPPCQSLCALPPRCKWALAARVWVEPQIVTLVRGCDDQSLSADVKVIFLTNYLVYKGDRQCAPQKAKNTKNKKKIKTCALDLPSFTDAQTTNHVDSRKLSYV